MTGMNKALLALLLIASSARAAPTTLPMVFGASSNAATSDIRI